RSAARTRGGAAAAGEGARERRAVLPTPLGSAAPARGGASDREGPTHRHLTGRSALGVPFRRPRPAGRGSSESPTNAGTRVPGSGFDLGSQPTRNSDGPEGTRTRNSSPNLPGAGEANRLHAVTGGLRASTQPTPAAHRQDRAISPGRRQPAGFPQAGQGGAGSAN